MGMLERLSDARGTLEGKIVAVVLAILLVLPVATVTAFADHDDDGQAVTASEVEQTQAVQPQVVEETADKGATPVAQPEPATEPAQPTAAPEPSQAAQPSEGPAAQQPAEEEEDQNAVLALNIDEGATVLYNDEIYTAYSDEMRVRTDQDTIFAVGANEGFMLIEDEPVVLVAFDGSETELPVDSYGMYTITPEQIEQHFVLQVRAAKSDAPNPSNAETGVGSEEAVVAEEDAIEESIEEESAAFATRINRGDVEVVFNANGGSGTTPEPVFANKGEKIIIPESDSLSRADFELRGWAEIDDANLIDGNNPKLIPIYKVGDNYEITQDSGKVTLYAVWQQVSGSSKGRIVITLLKRGLPSPPEPAIVQDEEFYKDYDWDGKNAQGTNMRDVLFNTEEGWNNMNTLMKTEAGREELKTKWANVDNILDYMNPVFTTTGATSVNGILTPKFWALVNDCNVTKKLWDPKTEHVEFYAVKYQSNTLKYHIDGMIVPNDYALLTYEANADNIQGSLPSNKQFQLFDGKASGTVADPATDGNMARVGHVFAGWNTKADGTGDSYAAGDTIEFTSPGTVTLYAQWKVQYGVSYAWTGLDRADKFINPDGGDVYEIPTDANKYIEGSKYTLDTHHKPGDIAYAYVNDSVVAAYVFSGWKLNGELAGSIVVVDSDLRFIGEWAKISHSGDVKIEGQEYSGGTEYVQTIEATFNDPNGTTTDAGTPSYVYKDKNGNVLEGAPSDAGAYTITAIWPATSTHPEVASKPCGFEISPKPVTLLSASADKTFDGKTLKAESMETMEGFVNGQGIDITYTGERTNPGVTPNTYTFVAKENTNLDNYIIPEGAGTIGSDGLGICTGTLTVTGRDDNNRIPVKLVAASSLSNVYDGTIKSASGLAQIEATGADGNIVSGDPTTASFQYGTNTYTVSNFTAGASAMDAGSYPTTFATPESEDFIVKDAQGNIITNQFDVSTEKGILVIAPRTVNLTSQTKTKVYDGKPLQAANILDVDSVLANEATVVATGTITNAFDGPDGKGTVENTIADPVQKVDAAEGANPFKPGNYTINKKSGTLTILPQSIDPDDNKGQDPNDPDDPDNRYKGVKVSNLADEQYNGKAWADRKKPVATTESNQPLSTDDYAVVATTLETTNVGTKTVTVTGKGNYTGIVTRTYEVTKAPVEIYVHSYSKKFGEADPAFDGDIVGLFQNDLNGNAWDVLGTVDYRRFPVAKDATTLEEEVGNYQQVLDAIVANLNSNYQTPVVHKGDFVINAADAPTIAIDADSLIVAYDGRSHSISASVMPSEGWALEYSTESANGPWNTQLPEEVNAGAYPVWVKTVDRPNYNGAGPISATLVINPAPVTITVNDATKVAGSDDPEFTGTIEGEIAGHELTGVSYFRKGDSEAVGTYVDDLTASFDENSNYRVTVVDGDFTITPIAVPVTPPTPPTPGPLDTLITTVTDFLATPVIGPGAAAAEAIADDGNPLAQIEDDETPMSAFDHPFCWVHYYILLGIIITAIYGGGVIARRLGYNHKVKKYEDDVLDEDKSKGAAKSPVSREGVQPVI